MMENDLDFKIMQILEELYYIDTEQRQKLKNYLNLLKEDKKKKLFVLLYERYQKAIARLREFVADINLISRHMEEHKEVLDAERLLENL
ncbi:hypothetical protein [Candidatus Absconditicoccus praedator]|uniref:hypothetical protein n=1 Tax=Candidatus Absconditicoccus praedator TaxID=2735562 RepID=UPI001E605155|nr:hypothetical protein [Candidatus Absconditicoccus praedator]UFX83133.1 hypothetical protein HLG78_03290 [Candidatus Absconditicoccus praedator]